MEGGMRVGVACNKLGLSGGMEQYALKIIEALLKLGHIPCLHNASRRSLIAV